MPNLIFSCRPTSFLRASRSAAADLAPFLPNPLDLGAAAAAVASAGGASPWRAAMEWERRGVRCAGRGVSGVVGAASMGSMADVILGFQDHALRRRHGAVVAMATSKS